LSPRQRHILKARAVVEAATKPVVLCGASAAAVLGIPILDDWPSEVHVLVPSAPGGRSKAQVRRHGGLCDPVERDGLLVTPIARTALDLVLSLDFAPAVATLDWALWRRNANATSRAEIAREFDSIDPRYRRAHARTVIDFATDLSDSFGESMTRAGMHLLGYPAPELQVKFVDAQGEIVPDYYFRRQRQAGEFDGKVKFTRGEYLRGRHPSEVVWAEKKREDRLRRQPAVDGVFRVVWEEALNLPRLDAILREAGLRPDRG
jgi:hypothetical protein